MRQQHCTAIILSSIEALQHHHHNKPIPIFPHTPQPKGLNLPLPTTNGNNNGNHNSTTSTIGNTMPHDNLHHIPLCIYNLHPTTSTTHRDLLTPIHHTHTHHNTPPRTPSEPPKATTVGDPPPKATTVHIPTRLQPQQSQSFHRYNHNQHATPASHYIPHHTW